MEDKSIQTTVETQEDSSNEFDFTKKYGEKIGEMSTRIDVSKHKGQYIEKIVLYLEKLEEKFLPYTIMTKEHKIVLAERFLLDEIKEKNLHSQKLVGKEAFTFLFTKISSYYKFIYNVLKTDYHIGKKTIVLNLDDTGDKSWGCIQEPNLTLGDKKRDSFALCGMWKKNRRDSYGI